MPKSSCKIQSDDVSKEFLPKETLVSPSDKGITRLPLCTERSNADTERHWTCEVAVRSAWREFKVKYCRTSPEPPVSIYGEIPIAIAPCSP